MSKIVKSQMRVDGNHIQMSVPFAKVDKENRLVSGFATLDNIDTQGDVVLATASSQAFKRARGNIREMHQPIAVGKIVDFQEKEFFDQDSGEMYTGIYVTAYVSKGAPDTWEKVLDETLTGFSIGGEIIEASNEFVKDANGGKGATVRFIKNYDLTELSLVDNPANQLANVFSIQKSQGVSFMKGMTSETFIENVFICKFDDTVIVKDSASEECPVCGKGMENAGWFEESGENRVDKVSSIVSKFRNPAETEAAPNSDSEGGVEMGNKDEVTKSEQKPEEVEEETPTVEEPVEVSDPAEGEEAEEVSETDEAAAEEEVAEVVEVEDDEAAIAKRFDELHDAITNSLESTKAETAERVAELEKVVTEATDNFLTKTQEIEAKINGLVENVATTKAAIAAMEARVEKMNSSDALRKSADLEDSVEKNVQSNSLWNGAFSPGPRKSGFSVDDL